MEQDYLEEERFLQAQKRIKNIKGFYTHLLIYLIAIIIWILILVNLNEVSNSLQYGFWGMGYGLVAMALFWGVGIVFHWFQVFGKEFIFSKDWEKRKVKELMDNDKL